MTIISYAQNYEDVVLNRVFGGQQVGFYVDVGAYHPVDGSVTKLFYDRGWSGINVEPGSVFDLLAEQRPRDVNLRMVVLDYAGEASFLETAFDAGMSHVVERGGGVTVRCDTLEAIVQNHGMGRPVDFVKIDAEGAEVAIVRSTNWRFLRPRVMVIESTKPWSNVLTNESWEQDLISAGYVRAYFDGINCFYVPEEEWAILGRHFQVPVNVLDGVVAFSHHAALGKLTAVEGNLAGKEAELAAAHGRLAGEAAKMAATQSKLVGREAELAAAHGKLDELTGVQGKLGDKEAELAAVHRKVTSTEAELASAQRKVEETQTQLNNVQGEHAQALRTASMLRQELDAARTELGRQEAYIRELTIPPSAPIEPPTVSRRPLHRRLARFCYSLVRPVVRPVSWRVRTFLTGPMLTQIDIIENRLGRIDERTAHPLATAQLEHLARTVAEFRGGSEARLDNLARSTAEFHRGSAAQLDNLARSTAEFHEGSSAKLDHFGKSAEDFHAGSLERFQQLATSIEDVVVTLALASPHHLAGGGSPNESTWGVLRLPRGRHVEFEVSAVDLSVGAALGSSNGDWEPHVRRYFESVVKPDWVCLDIGANVGAHTLSLAVLAHKGRVIAFEPDPANYAVLTRNAAALPRPKATIEPVHIALWHSPGYLTVGAADELAGCAFVSSNPTDAANTEERLRAVVDPGAIGELELHVRLARVAGARLDDWVLDHPLQRLDLIKLDVEGAEANVIRGADQTLHRLRPQLLVEYNPACAATYFGQPADALYHELAKHFASIHVVEPDGSLTPIPGWTTLESRLADGKGWEDLVCTPETEGAVETALSGDAIERNR
jgi:FkbM family methyltransferase